MARSGIALRECRQIVEAFYLKAVMEETAVKAKRPRGRKPRVFNRVLVAKKVQMHRNTLDRHIQGNPYLQKVVDLQAATKKSPGKATGTERRLNWGII